MVALLLGLVTCTQIAPPAQIKTAVSPTPAVQEFEVPAGDVTLFTRAAGNIESGKVLVASNGGPGLTSNYMRNLEALAGPDLAVVTYDQRGNGRSTSPDLIPANFELADYAADIEAIRDTLSIEQIYLLGHSFGGVVAMNYTLRYPDRVRSLILLGSGPPSWRVIQDAFTSFGRRVAAMQADGHLPQQLNDSLEEILPAYFSDPAFSLATDDPGGAPEQNETVNELSWQALDGYDFTADLAALRLPVLILYGADDPFGLPMAEASRDALSSAEVTFILLDQCGHFWHECPEAAFGEIRPFLDRSSD